MSAARALANARLAQPRGEPGRRRTVTRVPSAGRHIPAACPDVVTIVLHDGSVAVFDREDLPLVAEYRWHRARCRATSLFYAVCRPRINGSRAGNTTWMHRLILGMTADDPRVVDHINGDGLDNRRCNLRAVPAGQNQWNMRPQKGRRFKGTYWVRRNKRRPWASRIRANGRYLHLGYFPTEEDAARAYDAAAVQHFGEMARLNFPKEAA